MPESRENRGEGWESPGGHSTGELSFQGQEKVSQLEKGKRNLAETEAQAEMPPAISVSTVCKVKMVTEAS